MNAPFRISRLLNARRPTVWEVYTQARHLPNWLGPKGSTMPHCALNLRVGGVFQYHLRMPNGMEMWAQWHFLEITSPERLVVLQNFCNSQGTATRHPMAPVWPLYTHSTTTFTAQGNQTLLSIEWQPHEASAEEIAIFAASHASMTQGWGGNLDVLEQYLSLLQAPTS